MVKDLVQLASYKFEFGTILVSCIYLPHWRLETYPQPEKFNPERFLNRKFSAYEYLPFGGGSRGCIRTTFLIYEMKLVLATILSRFEPKLAEQRSVYPVRRGITIIFSANGV